MLFVMSLALMPLGLIALFASLQYSHVKRLQHVNDARLIATSEARQIDLVIFRAANVVRFASGAANAGGARCRTLVTEAGRLLPPGTGIALYAADGSLRCATPRFHAPSLPPPTRLIGIELGLLGETGLRFTTRSESGSYGIGQLTPAVLRAAVSDGGTGIMLRQGATSLQLGQARVPGTLDRRIAVSAPIGGGQLSLTATVITAAISAVEVVLILLPLMMWAAAAAIAWLVINQLLLRPLGRLQRAVANAAAAGAASGHFVMPRLQTPAREIRTLGEAFAAATDQIAQREARLEEGLHHQVLLTREVHHRVKNNLQVVASLINLHARGTSGEVAAAYASIQRRVDALAVVHRNHYAELEKHNGVSLRALVAELTANLRATAPVGAGNFSITLEMAPVHVSQDTAVPVAFLITELIELLMERAPGWPVRITLATLDAPDRAMLTITSPALDQLGERDSPDLERFGRIITGLARQLRSSLTFDDIDQHYSIAVPILREPEPSDAAD